MTERDVRDDQDARCCVENSGGVTEICEKWPDPKWRSLLKEKIAISGLLYMRHATKLLAAANVGDGDIHDPCADFEFELNLGKKLINVNSRLLYVTLTAVNKHQMGRYCWVGVHEEVEGPVPVSWSNHIAEHSKTLVMEDCQDFDIDFKKIISN